MFHCLIVFNSQNEPLFAVYDEYLESSVISPHRSCYNEDNAMQNVSVNNILMQVFTPLLASQSAMMDIFSTRFYSIDLDNHTTLILQKVHNCNIVILIAEQCLFRRQHSIITKKLELLEWLISSFYGICWNRMGNYNNSWLKIILKEMWIMDENEFNLNLWCIERIDLSPHLKLTEKVLDVLVANSRFLRQVNERKMKHQLVLVGSKLFCLYTSDAISSLRPRHTLLFVLICNAMFNRFSRAKETSNDDSCLKPNGKMLSTKSSVASLVDGDFSEASYDISHSIRSTIKPFSGNSSTISSSIDADPFILWIENKDGFKYRVVKIFLKYRTGFLTPCHLHLVKLARNVVYIGVEENLDNHSIVATIDKSIRLIRSVIVDNDKQKDVTAILRSRISPSIDKLTYLKVAHSQQLIQTLKLCNSKESSNSDFLERVLKELLRLLELIYCQYYLSFPIKVSDKLCKSFLRCFLGVKKEMSDYLAILNVKALRNLPPTSFYPLYPGLIHFIFTTRKLDQLLISPVIDQDIFNESKIARLHFLVDLCRDIAMSFEAVMSQSRLIEVCDQDIRCTYHRKRYIVSEEKYHEYELTLFHISSVSLPMVKRHLYLLLDQFLSDPENQLLKLTS